MERGDCQFMVVPPRHQYEEDHQFMHQLMVAAAGTSRTPTRAPRAGSRRWRWRRGEEFEAAVHGGAGAVAGDDVPRAARQAGAPEKAELARELGLQPRQVAIWFQNKRARWRSKQLEHDYAAPGRTSELPLTIDVLSIVDFQVDELRGRLSERQDQSGSCEVNDKRNSTTSSLVQEDGATPPSLVDASEDSAATEYDYDHMAYEGLHDPFFCATPDLWDTWPLLEWNAVA
ncbi:unnamed protein product [Miscanthus lutarioriparius]|uniref:Homeobox-leucine zipper protein n=1 Tax=Miscanthus lutarioriparius TaxID=422564 RepID=A0A811PKJ6_9POAL|nr:unnamed protein product [Miscanthus lutarioriparius]